MRFKIEYLTDPTKSDSVCQTLFSAGDLELARRTARAAASTIGNHAAT